MVRLLLTLGADVNAGIDSTTLICAATQLHTDVVVCLLEAGADLEGHSTTRMMQNGTAWYELIDKYFSSGNTKPNR